MGFHGLKPKVSVIRKGERREATLEDKVTELLLNRTIVGVDYEEHSLTLVLDNGATFSMNNSGGFMEPS